MPKTQSRAGVNYYAHGMFAMELEPAKDPETKLWQAVLGQAFEDAFGPPKYETSQKDRKEALNFLKDNESEEFRVLCENAGFDPGYIKRKARKKFAEKFVSAINNLSTKVRNYETKQNA